MKDVPIKFRGKRLTSNEDFVFGDLIQYPYDLPIIRVFDDEECKKGLYAFDDYEVYPESVSQLVGYDADGNEVYEGDKLFDEEHNTYVTAELYPGVHTQFYRKV
ncbi:MAG: hypothetical protein IJS29_00805 [Selenomonadaceae bacterium]|nr:hypothetical protein [Selenomonadaceae bacterium]